MRRRQTGKGGGIPPTSLKGGPSAITLSVPKPSAPFGVMEHEELLRALLSVLTGIENELGTIACDTTEIARLLDSVTNQGKWLEIGGSLD